MKGLFLAVITVVAFCPGCSSTRDSPKYQLGDDMYDFKQQGGRYQKAFVYVETDTLKIVEYKKPNAPIIPIAGKDEFFLKRSFDVDIMTIAFRYRPGTSTIPRQLTTDFNGNAYLGYRFDRFRIKMKQTPVGLRKHYSHRAFTIGAFGGLGATAITPSTTDYQITDEYDGLILTRGIAAMFGINNLTVGMGIGWDYLTDRDKNIWIYQNKTWYGLTVGLNLN